MTALSAAELTGWRMHALGLTAPPRQAPADVVRHLLGVQAQDHQPATWSLGQRTAGATQTTVDAAFADGAFVRTHVLRPTWHFVHLDDLRWLQRLTGPRVQLRNASAYREEGWDAAGLAQATEVLLAALETGPLTRAQLSAVLAAHGVAASGRRLGCLLMHAELEALICSGPLAGKQHTHRLVPPGPAGPSGDDALALLGRRYAAGHGPVEARDLASWASLTLAQARAALADLPTVEVEGETYAHAPDQELPTGSPAWHLLQTYDELVAGYRAAAHVLGPAGALFGQGTALPTGVVMAGHRLAGRFRRVLDRDRVRLEVLLTAPDAPPAGLHRAVADVARFLGREPTLALL